MDYSAAQRVDVHGKNKHQTKITLDSALRKAGSGVYRIAVIHGFNHGTELREMIRRDYAVHPKVLRVERGANDGETVLVLKERYT